MTDQFVSVVIVTSLGSTLSPASIIITFTDFFAISGTPGSQFLTMLILILLSIKVFLIIYVFGSLDIS